MFFRPRFSTSNYHRRGFRPRGNIFLLLLVFFLIALFLHYGGRTKPVVAFWNDLRSLVGIGPSHRDREDNPYKAPEPDEDVATDEKPHRKRKKRSEEGSASDTQGQTANEKSTNVRFDFENQVDFLLPGLNASDDLIRHDGYTLRYVDRYKVADWVAYPLLAYKISGDADREGEQFQPDPEVKAGTALSSDYTKSGYDRGHLAPAGDFKFSQRMMRETFFMSNIAPQAPQFNRGIWKELEEQVRRWAVRDNGLYVITGSVLKPGMPTIGRVNKVSVPPQFYKVILYCNNSPTDRPSIRMIGFLLNNEESDSALSQFVVPVDQIEQLTGIDFFPKLPDDIEKKLESKRRSEVVADWFSAF